MRVVSAAIVASALFIVPSYARATTCDSVSACIFYTNPSGSAIEGFSTNFNALYGISPNSHGTDGRSGTSYGAVGITYADGRFSSTARAGVFGQDSNANGGPLNEGVAGVSTSGVGGAFVSSTNIGLVSEGASAGIVSFSQSTNGDAGYFQSSLGPGIYTESDSGYALVTNNAATTGDSIEMATSSPMLLEGLAVPVGTSTGTVEVSIDASGNEVLAGALTMSGSPQYRTRTIADTDVRSYGARTSSPTIEDFGTARLQNGIAFVPLERTFASTIDARSYMVFLTPHGDSSGLYVETTAAGFDVRENKGGRSSLAFDYRIVAKPRDAALAARLPAMAPPSPASFRKPPAARMTTMKALVRPLRADGSEFKARGTAAGRV